MTASNKLAKPGDMSIPDKDVTPIYIVWRMTNPLLPGLRKIELVTADKVRAYTLAAVNWYMEAEEHHVEDMP